MARWEDEHLNRVHTCETALPAFHASPFTVTATPCGACGINDVVLARSLHRCACIVQYLWNVCTCGLAIQSWKSTTSSYS